jgi:acetyltransferase-like isoleucine patch superfamily enzyme
MEGEILNLVKRLYRIIYYLINNIKLQIYTLKVKLSFRSVGEFTRIFYAKTPEPYNIEVGHHVFINEGCDLISSSGRIIIGNFVMIGSHTTIIAQNHDISDYKKPMVLNHKYLSENVIIEDDVWIGANVTILPGVKIARGSVVGAGSVVTKNVAPFTIVGGVPAVKIRDRFNNATKKKAKMANFKKFNNTKIDWFKWGVGKKQYE